MPRLITELEPEDSSTKGSFTSGKLTSACKKLRDRAFRATSTLSLANRKTIRGLGRRVLQNLASCTGAVDVHFFRIAESEKGPNLMGLKLHTGTSLSAHTAESLNKFQFQLLPPRFQECIQANQIAKIGGKSNGGGRLLSRLIDDTGCVTYYLCPLFVDGRIKGLLGLACKNEISTDNGAADEFFELLKLNGTILLTNILRVRRETRRNRKLAEWRRITNQACDFAVAVDAQFVVRDTAAFGAGENTPQLNGLRLTDIVSRTFHREVLQHIKTAVETSEVRTTNFQISLDHEGPRWYLARIEPSRRSNDSYATLYLTDNHPDRLHQEEIRELTDHLVKASRLSLLGQMSTEFAHQLNQPLQAILNYCNMMQRRIERGTTTEENSLKALANIETSVLHSASIIQRIRDFVKFRTLITEEVQVQELISLAMMMVVPTARGWNADIISPAETLDLEVLVDRAQTTHVLVNLIMNALEACRESGATRPQIQVFVREAADQNRAVIGVRDNGPGLPVEDPEVVFRKFYSGKKDGLGMGLAISREVCESQGGNLTARNNVDSRGCTFLVAMKLNNNSGSDTVELESIDVDELPTD